MQMCYTACVALSFLLSPLTIFATEPAQAEVVCTACAITQAPFRSLHLQTDKQAYEYCLKHKKSFVAVMWPLAQGKDKAIERIFKKYGKLLYYKTAHLNFKKAYHLLQKAHPHIPDMSEHVAWYFPEGTFALPARIFVLEFESAEIAVACKLAIRSLYNLQYRAIHINDTHSETVELAEFFFR